MSKHASKVDKKQGDATVLDLLHGIRSGGISPDSISATQRLNVIEHMRVEGCSVVDAAGLLKVNEKTIRRDIQKLRELNAVTYNPEFANQMAGMLITTVEASIQHLRRKLRENDGTLQEIAFAHQTIWNLANGLAARLQSLGFLPTAPAQIQGAFYHGVVGGVEDPAATLAEIERLDAIRKEQALPAELGKKLEVIKKNVEETRQAKAALPPPENKNPESPKGDDHAAKNDPAPQ